MVEFGLTFFSGILLTVSSGWMGQQMGGGGERQRQTDRQRCHRIHWSAMAAKLSLPAKNSVDHPSETLALAWFDLKMFVYSREIQSTIKSTIHLYTRNMYICAYVSGGTMSMGVFSSTRITFDRLYYSLLSQEAMKCVLFICCRPISTISRRC